MSRRSARILSRRSTNRKPVEGVERELQEVSRKRKAEEDCETLQAACSSKDNKKKRRKQSLTQDGSYLEEKSSAVIDMGIPVSTLLCKDAAIVLPSSSSCCTPSKTSSVLRDMRLVHETVKKRTESAEENMLKSSAPDSASTVKSNQALEASETNVASNRSHGPSDTVDQSTEQALEVYETNDASNQSHCPSDTEDPSTPPQNEASNSNGTEDKLTGQDDASTLSDGQDEIEQDLNSTLELQDGPQTSDVQTNGFDDGQEGKENDLDSTLELQDRPLPPNQQNDGLALKDSNDQETESVVDIGYSCDLHNTKRIKIMKKSGESGSLGGVSSTPGYKNSAFKVHITNGRGYVSEHCKPYGSPPSPWTESQLKEYREKTHPMTCGVKCNLSFEVNQNAASLRNAVLSQCLPQHYGPKTTSPTPSHSASPSSQDFSPTVVELKRGQFYRVPGSPGAGDRLYVPPRESPLPLVDWADQLEVWAEMQKKELRYNSRSPATIGRHPTLSPRVRSVLLDWLNEVAEAFKSHRESFYLATDLFDRYMAITADITKGQLQLIGITCLFIATKYEEIYPPKISEFVYVCDGACDPEEIMAMELVILNSLKFNLTPATPCFWVNVYLQLLNYDERKKECLVLPQYSQHAYIQIMRLLDLCILDNESQRFNYSILAAAAMYHISTEQLALFASNYKWSDIEACVTWMVPFAVALRTQGPAALTVPEGITVETAHLIQVHSATLTLLESVHLRIQEMEESGARSSPEPLSPCKVSGMMTPPKSTNPKAAATATPPSSKTSTPTKTPGDRDNAHTAQGVMQPIRQTITSPAQSPERKVISSEHGKYSLGGVGVGRGDMTEQENNDPHSNTPPNLPRNLPPSPVS